MDLAPYWDAGLVTLQIAGGGWLLAIVVGLVIVALRELNVPALDKVLGFSVTLVRSTPELILIYIVFFGIAYLGVRFDSIPAAIIALGVSEGAFVSEYFRGALLTVSSRQRQAAQSLGMSQLTTFRSIVLPQAVPFAIPPMVNAFCGLLKTATLAAAVGAPEVLYVGREQMRLSGDILQVSLVLVLLYVVVTIPLTMTATHMERRARSRLIA